MGYVPHKTPEILQQSVDLAFDESSAAVSAVPEAPSIAEPLTALRHFFTMIEPDPHLYQAVISGMPPDLQARVIGLAALLTPQR